MADPRHPRLISSGSRPLGVTRRNAVGLILGAPLLSACTNVQQGLSSLNPFELDASRPGGSRAAAGRRRNRDGNDTYFVDNAGDAVTESGGQGTDAVFASVNYGLTANVETLVLQGGADLQGFGNALANTIFGNSRQQPHRRRRWRRYHDRRRSATTPISSTTPAIR